MSRAVFFVSDCTGLTVKDMGRALLAQFPGEALEFFTYSFVETAAKAEEINGAIAAAAGASGQQPILFASIINRELMAIFNRSGALVFNYFDSFLPRLETALGVPAQYSLARIRGINNRENYDARMEAVNFSLNHDDGVSDRELKDADVILVGVSRSGKTPTCLYLAMQYGLRAANYPLTEEDLESTDLPRMIRPYRSKLFGLTIQPERLQAIRQQRRPDSRYAQLNTCINELREAQAIFRTHHIPYANTTDKSVEELSAYIVQFFQLKRPGLA